MSQLVVLPHSHLIPPLLSSAHLSRHVTAAYWAGSLRKISRTRSPSTDEKNMPHDSSLDRATPSIYFLGVNAAAATSESSAAQRRCSTPAQHRHDVRDYHRHRRTPHQGRTHGWVWFVGRHYPRCCGILGKGMVPRERRKAVSANSYIKEEHMYLHLTLTLRVRQL